VKGLYLREGRYLAGANVEGRWAMKTLDAESLTEAKRERESWLAGLREGRVAPTSGTTFRAVFSDWQASRRISERTAEHERHLLDKRLGSLADRPLQKITATEIATVMREQRKRYAELSCLQTFRVVAGVCAHGLRRGTITRNPVDGLADSERPTRQPKRTVARLAAETVDRFVAAASSLRWKTAFGLAGYAGLRLGEIRALRWQDIDLDAGTITVSRSALPDGTIKQPKTRAGVRDVPLLPALRRILVSWKLESPRSQPSDFVVATADGLPAQERTIRRAFAATRKRAGLDGGEERLSMHALRHSFASLLATDLDPRADDAGRDHRPRRCELHPPRLCPRHSRHGDGRLGRSRSGRAGRRRRLRRYQRPRDVVQDVVVFPR
jgi:integrase